MKAKIARLEKKINNLSNSNSKSKCDFIEMCDNFLPPSTAKFVKVQARLHGVKKYGERYPLFLKRLCLSINYISPRAYRLLRTIFRLPSISTLNDLTTNWQYSPGLNPRLFNMLKIKLNNFSNISKNCVLCFDEISIKSNLYYNKGTDEIIGFDNNDNSDLEQDPNKIKGANHVLVLMARGIAMSWKQPLAYFFAKNTYNEDDFKDVLFDCIRKLRGIGATTHGIVSDMGKNFYSPHAKSVKDLAKKLGISTEKTFFNVDDEQIYYFFDTPHLIKATRNNLMAYDFKIKDETASWRYIIKFFEEDQKQDFRLAPKLTSMHIKPTNFEKMKVKYATQILSATVAASLNTYIQSGKIPKEARSTVNLITKFNNLFDVLNSSSPNSPKQYCLPYSGSDFQKNFLNEMLEYIKTIQIFNRYGEEITETFSFLKCWQITIHSLIGLYDILKEKEFKFILTRRINQDPLENFFGKLINLMELDLRINMVSYRIVDRTDLYLITYFNYA